MSTRPTRSRSRDESGVIAVLVALMAIVLLGIAALAVDMGNAYARKRLVQTEVDLAALAGGAKLPATDTASRLLAVEAVLDYLQRNATFGQEQDGWTAAQLQDGSISNGEVVFESDGRMRVTAPPATVNFGLAGALGFSAADVNAAASVQIGSPGVLMPMWLPSSCSVGQVLGDTGPGGSGSDSGAVFTPPASDNQLTVSATPVTTAYGSITTVSVTLGKLAKDVDSATVAFTFGATGPVSYPVTFPKTTTNNQSRTVTLSVGTNVSNTSGQWRLWGVVAGKYSKSSVAFTVEGAGTLECSTSQRGNFGQLDSPRKDG
ncbi:MAG: pilus assembly protein TadG-related protein, partial [Actinomycetota bacterium]|nr:pilus assembly protein TadG-related protein [Actinomycetota bacterium]